MTNPKHTDTSRSGDLVKRMRYTAKHGIFTAIKNGRYASLDEAADRIEALKAKLAEKDALLRECGEALAEYACHGGPDLPCIRSEDQCRTECGKIAGDTLAKIKDATDG